MGFPEFREERMVGRLKERSLVLPVGLDLVGLQSAARTPEREQPLILWNQRWEYDKNPEAFFQAILSLAAEGIPFELAVCGESFQQPPEIFDTAARKLNSHVIHWGYARQDLYRKLLWDATLTVSTAFHEFFGISILEAAFCQTLPLVPNRLSYPEILPPGFHQSCLYDREEKLVERLEQALVDPQSTRKTAKALAAQIGTYNWKKLATEYDRLLEEVEPIR